MKPLGNLALAVGFVYVGCGVAAVIGLASVLGWSTSVDLIGYLAARDEWRLLSALILFVVAPVLALIGLLMTRRHPGRAWPFVLGVTAGAISVSLVVPQWTNIVPTLAWWGMGVAGISRLAATYLLVARATQPDDHLRHHVRSRQR